MIEDDKILRLKEIMAHFNANQTSFSRLTGIDQTNISGMLRGIRPIGEGVINKLVISIDLNKHWFLTGEGCMIMPKPEEKKEEKEIIPETFNEFFEALKRKDHQIDKRDEQIDRLITLLENERGISSNGDKKSKGA